MKNKFKYQKSTYYSLMKQGRYQDARNFERKYMQANADFYNLLSTIIFAIANVNRVARTEE
ncbi:MAG: hypothetical protein NZZ41_02830 [Candidatus Dojkabacteria bacterium]|nr:hypothetical protein [Candidatus Dojkabacteria bacterium]